jgi:hypothetical protein
MFEKDKDILPIFSQVYTALKSKGIPFPEYVPDTSNQSSQQKQHSRGSNSATRENQAHG